MIRDLKIRSHDLDAVLNGRATIEIGEHDGDVEAGDRLRLREWDADAQRYLERQHVVVVTGIEDTGGGRTVLTVRDDPPEREGPVS